MHVTISSQQVHSVDRNRRRGVQVQRYRQIHLRLGIGAAATDAGVMFQNELMIV